MRHALGRHPWLWNAIDALNFRAELLERLFSPVLLDALAAPCSDARSPACGDQGFLQGGCEVAALVIGQKDAERNRPAM